MFPLIKTERNIVSHCYKPSLGEVQKLCTTPLASSPNGTVVGNSAYAWGRLCASWLPSPVCLFRIVWVVVRHRLTMKGKRTCKLLLCSCSSEEWLPPTVICCSLGCIHFVCLLLQGFVQWELFSSLPLHLLETCRFGIQFLHWCRVAYRSLFKSVTCFLYVYIIFSEFSPTPFKITFTAVKLLCTLNCLFIFMKQTPAAACKNEHRKFIITVNNCWKLQQMLSWPSWKMILFSFDLQLHLQYEMIIALSKAALGKTFLCSEIKFPFIFFSYFLSFFFFCANGDAKFFLGYGAGTVVPVFVTTETKLSAEYVGLWVSYNAETKIP